MVAHIFRWVDASAAGDGEAGEAAEVPIACLPAFSLPLLLPGGWCWSACGVVGWSHIDLVIHRTDKQPNTKNARKFRCCCHALASNHLFGIFESYAHTLTGHAPRLK